MAKRKIIAYESPLSMTRSVILFMDKTKVLHSLGFSEQKDFDQYLESLESNFNSSVKMVDKLSKKQIKIIEDSGYSHLI